MAERTGTVPTLYIGTASHVHDPAEEPTPSTEYSGRKGCANCLFTAGVFFIVALCAILVPLAIILLPTIITLPATVYKANTTAMTSGNSPKTSPSGTPPPPPPTPAPPLPPSPGTTRSTIWTFDLPAIPAMCQRMSPAVPDNLLDIRDQASSFPSDVVNRSEQVYCLYNNSRFRKPRGHDFLPLHVPWWFCPNLVYWSVGVNDGRLKLRAPKFDHRYGLYKLRIVADAHRGGTQLLMTIGGYPEDTGQLYRVGAGTATAQSLGREVLETVRNAGLNGVNIHLIEDPPCEHYFKYQADTIATFVDTLATLVEQSYETNPFRITMMVGTDAKLGLEVSRSLLSRLDHVFIDTHSAVTSQLTSFDAYCAQYDEMTEKYIRQAHMSPSMKLCPSLSLIFPARWLKYSNPTFSEHVLTKRPGFSSRLDFCAEKRTVVALNDTAHCTAFHTAYPREVAVFPSVEKLRETFKGACVLVNDFDYDMYNPTECGQRVAWPTFRDFYAAL